MRTDPSLYIPTSADTSEQWIEWYKALDSWFSKNEAKTQFLRFWNQRAGAGSEADTYQLRSYMEEQGVDMTTTTGGEITDSVFGVFDWFGDTFNWIRGIVIGAAIAILALIAFYFYRSIKKDKSPVQMAMGLPLPQRRILKALPV